MKKYDFTTGDDFLLDSGTKHFVLNTPEDLKELLKNLDVHAEAEHRFENLYIVKHMKNIGGSQYIANASLHFGILNKLSERIEAKESYVNYFIRLEGQEVSI